MAIFFTPKSADSDKKLRENVEYTIKAANHCPDDFAYKTDINSACAEAHAQLGHYLYKKGHLTEAASYYHKALEKNPEHITAYNQIGMIFFRLGNFTKSAKYFESIDKIATGNHQKHAKIDAKLSLALIYSEIGDKASIRKAYRYAIEAQKLDSKYQLTEDIMRKVMANEERQITKYAIKHLHSYNFKPMTDNSNIKQPSDEKDDEINSLTPN